MNSTPREEVEPLPVWGHASCSYPEIQVAWTMMSSFGKIPPHL